MYTLPSQIRVTNKFYPGVVTLQGFVTHFFGLAMFVGL